MRCDGLCWAQHEFPEAEFGVRDHQIVPFPNALVPKHDVAIEHAVAPASPAPPPEFAFHALERGQRRLRLKLAFDNGHRIGKSSLRRAERIGCNDP